VYGEEVYPQMNTDRRRSVGWFCVARSKFQSGQQNAKFFGLQLQLGINVLDNYLRPSADDKKGLLRVLCVLRGEFGGTPRSSRA
jgi:hypothetical protein